MSVADDIVAEALSHDTTAKYRSPDGIVAFVQNVLRANLADYQEDILRNFVKHKRASVRGPHGLGKTALSAWIVLWGVTCHGDDVKIITTASSWRQLIFYTWPEIKKWARRADWSQLGIQIRPNKELFERGIKLVGAEAFAVASDNPALIEGAHAKTLIYIFDEAKEIPIPTWDAAEGAFSGAGEDTDAVAYALAISTPGEPSGRFYDIHKRKPGTEAWWVRHVTLKEAMRAGRISQQWVKQCKKLWGEKSAVYQNRVLGEFAEDASDALIPLRWVEAAVERWHECKGKGEGRLSYGVDPARYGEDKTTIAKLVGRVLESLNYYSKQSTMQTAGRVAATVPKEVRVAIDTIGVGAGVYDRLRELEYSVLPVNVAEATDVTDKSGMMKFVNLRSAVWWKLREALDPDNPEALAIPDDPILIGDLTAPLYTHISSGRVKVESKDDIRLRIGRSTDAADALALAYHNATAAQSILIEGYDYG